MTSSSPHLLPSKSCITGRVLLWYKHDHLLHVSFFLFFFVIHGCQGTLIKISIFLLVRIFFFFISFISSVLNILLLGRSQIILLIISRLLLLNHCRFSKDGEVFFSRKEDSNGQLFCPSTRACFWLAIEEQNVSFILKYQET